jgi:glycosyltransferase involved in cell wall biosynthesis
MNQLLPRSPKRVTIGVVVKNSENTIGDAIRSITEQDYRHELLTIIVVDGNSVDRTLRIVREVLAKSDIELMVFSDRGKGLGTARQIVIDNANSDYLVWVDADVVIPRDYVANLVKVLEQDTHLGGVRATRAVLSPEGLTASLQELSLLIRQTPGNAWDHHGIFRMRTIREVGGYDRGIKGAAEDLDLIARIKRSGRLFSVSNAKYYHKVGSWTEIWRNRERAGYGIHYFRHKHEGIIRLWDLAPPIEFIVGLKEASVAYKLTRRKTCFLLPIFYLLRSIPWWIGYIRSFLDGYKYSGRLET